MSRVALWNMYNNTSPHNQHNNSNPSPPEVQQEALNLQRESPSPVPAVSNSPVSIKRERDEINDYQVPPAKRGLIHTNSDLTSRKPSINNNNHHHNISHNNPHVTPTKDDSKRSESPQTNENGNHLQSPMRHHKQNGFDSLGTTLLNGMQFKIISKGNFFFVIFKRRFFNFFLYAENSSTGEPQLVVKLELNGISFEGVLFPNTNNSSISTPSTEPMISPPKNLSPNSNSNSNRINVDDHKMNAMVS